MHANQRHLRVAKHLLTRTLPAIAEDHSHELLHWVVKWTLDFQKRNPLATEFVQLGERT